MPPKTTTTSSPKTQYLVLYNLLSLILWLGILLRLLLTYFLTSPTSGATLINPSAAAPRSSGSSTGSGSALVYPFLDIAYPATFDVLRWTQTLAVVEVVHAALGIVRTSVVTTGMQVASRLFVVWGIVQLFGQALLLEGSSGLMAKGQSWGLGGLPGFEQAVSTGARMGNMLGNLVGGLAGGKEMGEVQRNQVAYAGMLMAWSVTEVVRYLYFIYYAGSESGKAPALVTWFRYNTFFVLYPIGISCECWLIYQSLPFAAQLDERYALVLKAVLAIYVPGSYILYTHMVAQRRKVMKGKGKAKTG